MQGLLALGALGLVAGDEVLASAALAKLMPHLHDTRYTHHITFLRAAHASVRVPYFTALLNSRLMI